MEGTQANCCRPRCLTQVPRWCLSRRSSRQWSPPMPHQHPNAQQTKLQKKVSPGTEEGQRQAE